MGKTLGPDGYTYSGGDSGQELSGTGTGL